MYFYTFRIRGQSTGGKLDVRTSYYIEHIELRVLSPFFLKVICCDHLPARQGKLGSRMRKRKKNEKKPSRHPEGRVSKKKKKQCQRETWRFRTDDGVENQGIIQYVE